MDSRYKRNKDKVVYGHYRKIDNKLFYVGMGSRQRAFKRGKRGSNWYSQIKNDAFFVKILHDNLTSDEAIELEKELIAFCRHEGVALCNILPGGQRGYSLKGITNPNADTSIYVFINNELNLVEICSRSYLIQKYKLSRRGLNCLFDNSGEKGYKGWSLDFNYYPNIKSRSSLKLNKSKDLTVYNFLNVKTGRKESLTRVEFKAKYNINIKPLFCGKVSKSCLGWVLLKENDDD